VFWRIAKGGVGLPNEGAPWNSAMPAWEDYLTEEEIWSVIIFLYEQTGWHPRALEPHGADGAH
jgi:mono/diheme cytochrome c family protein